MIAASENQHRRLGLAYVAAFCLLLLMVGLQWGWRHSWQLQLVALLVLLPLILFLLRNAPWFRQAWQWGQALVQEVRQVSWPHQDEVVRFTILVGVIVMLLGALLWALDGLFVWALGLGLSG